MTHTPEPWRVDRLKDINDEIVIRAGNAVDFICMVVGRDKEQNARLIAAGPDILAALKEAIEFQNEDTECLVPFQSGDSFEGQRDEPCLDRLCHDHGCMVARVNRWRAAIAKAEARSATLTQPPDRSASE